MLIGIIYSQIVESSSLVSVIFREAVSHPYISFFHSGVITLEKDALRQDVDYLFLPHMFYMEVCTFLIFALNQGILRKFYNVSY